MPEVQPPRAARWSIADEDERGVFERRYTLNEAAALSAVPIHVAESGVPARIGADRDDHLPFSYLVYLRVLAELPLTLRPEDRSHLLLAIERGLKPSSHLDDIQLTDLLVLRIDKLVRTLIATCCRFFRWKGSLVVDANVLAGDPHLAQSRFSVYQVGSLRAKPDQAAWKSTQVAPILSAYPQLTEEDLTFAMLYVQAYPMVRTFG